MSVGPDAGLGQKTRPHRSGRLLNTLDGRWVQRTRWVRGALMMGSWRTAVRAGRLSAAALGVAALTACGGSVGDTLSPAVFRADSSTSPEDVVRAYLGALQEDDEAAATSLSTASYADFDGWAEDPPTIEDVTIAAAAPAGTQGTVGEEYAEAVFVPVTFTLHGADETMPDGPAHWGYVLVRDSSTEAWRIAGAGSV